MFLLNTTKVWLIVHVCIIYNFRFRFTRFLWLQVRSPNSEMQLQINVTRKCHVCSWSNCKALTRPVTYCTYPLILILTNSAHRNTNVLGASSLFKVHNRVCDYVTFTRGVFIVMLAQTKMPINTKPTARTRIRMTHFSLQLRALVSCFIVDCLSGVVGEDGWAGVPVEVCGLFICNS